MVKSANLGFPRIGANRELKKAVEAFWKGNISEQELQSVAKEIRINNWKLQQKAGLDIIPSNDFSFYDHILDFTATIGAVPKRYNFNGEQVDLTTYFAMARGRQVSGQDVVAMEMTKWYDTNYHYIVPEFDNVSDFKLSSTKIIDEYKEAKELGIETRPVIAGPISYLLMGKNRKSENSNLELLDKLLPVYKEIFSLLKSEGCKAVQLDEGYLVTDLNDEQKSAYKTAYKELSGFGLEITLATYFGDLRDNLDIAVNLPVQSLHIDCVRGENQLDEVLGLLPSDKTLSVGVVDGRNIWKNNLRKSLAQIKKAVEKIGSDRVVVAPSCSLIHAPVDLANETKMDAELKSWLAYATQKVSELAIIANIANDGKEKYLSQLQASDTVVESRKTSSRIHNQEVKDRASQVTEKDLNRESSFEERVVKQQELLKLPLLPITTIGSFPQTKELRAKRRQFKDGKISRDDYDAYIEELTRELMEVQDKMDIDVPVHGEYERNDMVEYFGEKLSGYAFSQNGWVQSYGSRCVKPPIIFGDVSRPNPMTVRWSGFAQTCTKRPVKGMLTGPVTMLQWSFVRDDQPRSETTKQIGLAIRDEVMDLEKAGIRLVQIDEPAIREGLPLRRDDWADYLKWAVDAFRLSAAGVEDATQIHTHMCYSEFNDIISNVADMDADVISIETSRSAMELLDAFVEFKYPNEIGPGVYDIHSPRIPNTNEMVELLDKALLVLKPEQVWVNPDCGLKTRGWKEVTPALENMVEATKIMRQKLNSKVA